MTAHGAGICHRLSPSVTAFSDGRGVTDCHRVSPSVTCARENLKAHLLIIEAKGTTGRTSPINPSSDRR
jgi:hypothetical protein